MAGHSIPQRWGPAQLNPVGEQQSLSFSTPYKAELEEIVRQSDGNLIKFIQYARRRALLPEDQGIYRVPNKSSKRFQHARSVDLVERAVAFQKEFATSDPAGPEQEFRILCYTNARVDWYNAQVRAALHIPDAAPFLPGEVYGYDAAKKIKGRKRFALVDTLGLLISVVVIEASCPERLGGVAAVLEAPEEATQDLKLIWVDQGFSGPNFARVVKQ